MTIWGFGVAAFLRAPVSLERDAGLVFFLPRQRRLLMRGGNGRG